MPEQEKNYPTTKEAKAAAIRAATTEAELDEMWAAWEARGMSREGLMHAAVLARKKELGVQQSEGNIERVERAAAALMAAAGLPPITGTMKR